MSDRQNSFLFLMQLVKPTILSAIMAGVSKISRCVMVRMTVQMAVMNHIVAVSQ